MPSIRPRRELRLPITSPMKSSGTTASTFIMGSSRIGPAFCTPSLKRHAAGDLEGHLRESTSWYEPSTGVTLTSTTG